MMNRKTTYKYTVGASQKGALTICLILATLVSGFSEAGPITTFDAPGAGTGAGQGTFAINVNDFGVAVGYFVDANIVPHGFVRSPFGQVTTIDAPGAGMMPGANQGTVAESINIEGSIAGQYQDTNFVLHCFLRYPDGHIITFDAPRAGTGANQGSLALDINSKGTIAGYSIDNNKVYHGFVRSPLGTFTSFDAPKAGRGSFQGTVTTLETGLNPSGALIGWYFDPNNAAHGYVREPNGVITSFDPPGATNTYPGSINPEGVIVGGALDANGIFHGFIRSAKGVITSFDVPGAGTKLGLPPGSEGTLALGITPFSLITGYWADSNTIYHGFVRYPNGAISKFDAPGAGTVPLSLQGTVPQGMNFWGEIVGYLQDSNYIYHGFIRIP
ncbi:MAG: hypothetical protein WB586_17145 [Chthoniobacterales bacterium]